MNTVKSVTRGTTTFVISSETFDGPTDRNPQKVWFSVSTEKGVDRNLWKDGTLNDSCCSDDDNEDLGDMAKLPGWFNSEQDAEAAIELWWTNNGRRTLKVLAEECLAIQDACNPLGLSKRYARALQDLRDELALLSLPCDTDAIKFHPINLWWVDKLHCLARVGRDGALSEAYDTLTKLIEEDKK